MDRQRLRLLSAALAAALATSGCAFTRGTRTVRPSARSLEAPDDAALVVIVGDTGAALPSITRVIDEDAEAVADVPDGAHAIFEADPGDHVYAAFGHDLPLEEGCVAGVRVRLEAGKTYAILVSKSDLVVVWKRSCVKLDLVALTPAESAGVLTALSPRRRVELLSPRKRAPTFAEDIDVRESALGTAKLRMSERSSRDATPRRAAR
ncbi:MAG: hypothetical protein KF819_18950 [Labilithrix sp.]|nr:hypothetical protein [Labilithrix sp.]